MSSVTILFQQPCARKTAESRGSAPSLGRKETNSTTGCHFSLLVISVVPRREEKKDTNGLCPAVVGGSRLSNNNPGIKENGCQTPCISRAIYRRGEEKEREKERKRERAKTKEKESVSADKRFELGVVEFFTASTEAPSNVSGSRFIVYAGPPTRSAFQRDRRLPARRCKA